MMRLHRYIRRRQWKWPTQGAFEKHFKGRYALHSQSIQAEIKRFFSNLQTTRTHRANGDRQARYPYKGKKWRPVIWKGQAVKRYGNKLVLPLKKGMPPIRVRIPKTFPHQKILQVELDHRELRITVEHASRPCNIPPGIAAGDPGVIRLLTVTDGIDTLSINGKALRSELQRHNKAKAELAEKRSECKKGSRRYRKLSKAIAKSYQRWENVQRNFLHHAANLVEDWVKEREIADTTQTCPACGHRHKPAKRLYRCTHPSCGFEGVRDEVGAANVPNFIVPQGNIKYRRPVKSCCKVGRRRCVDAHLGNSNPVLPAHTSSRLGSLLRDEQAQCAAPTAAKAQSGIPVLKGGEASKLH